MAEKIRGKRMMFVGDSIQRAQWTSLVCLLNSVIPESERDMRDEHGISVFTATVHSRPTNS
jgi:GDSL/SGNH-like Acyl-Esterase family found in Pmr5 and Cas1p